MKKYNLYLSEQQINALVLLSEEKGLSVSEIIRRALDEYIEKESNKNQLLSANQKNKKQ
jgi:metal-responsive CopG/Arc/MetJ family transcriptional regulator